MLPILSAGSRLPAKKSKSFKCSGDSVLLLIYQGDSKWVSRNKRVHSIELVFQSVRLVNILTLTLDVTEDGTLTTIAQELGYRNTDATVAPRIIDVICPKISIDNKEPNLNVEWTGNVGIGRKAVLVISTTYHEIHRWRVSVASVAEAGVARGNGGHVFFLPRDGYSQRFEISSNILEPGVSYEVTVEGLQLIDDRVDSSKNFRLVCRNSKTTPLRARTAFDSYRMQSLRLKGPTSSVASLDSPHRPSNAQVSLDLRIQIERSSFHQASVLISTNLRAAPADRIWKITVQKIATATRRVALDYSPVKEFVEKATGNSHRFNFPLKFQPGNRYQMTVEPLDMSGVTHQNPGNSVKQTAEFRAELTLGDIKILHSKALRHTAGYRSAPCLWLYRNKSEKYFQDILDNSKGIMKVYDKDNSGDPASPINLQIKGLFFLASVERGTEGEPLRDSPFGPKRICIPAEELLGKAGNLYFVDFYCMRGRNHQVTLVMTRPGSKTDRYCADRLLSLKLNDPANNPFLFYNDGRLQVSTRDQLLVEVLFTEDLDIRSYRLKSVPTVGKGSSTLGGIPKNPSCTLCNLKRDSDFPQF